MAKGKLDVKRSVRENLGAGEGEDWGARPGLVDGGRNEEGDRLLHQGREADGEAVGVHEEVRLRGRSHGEENGIEPLPVKLNLGCGKSIKIGFVNVDFEPHEGVDLQLDLNVLPWPFEDNSIDHVFASDCFEHLSPLGRVNGQANIIAVMDEVYRILKPGGILEVQVPSTDGPGAWQDPTHVTYWNRNTFLYFIENSAILDWCCPYKKFSMDGKDLGVADTVPDEFGIIWTCARLRKPNGPDKAG
jgi:SAM-dependent methyltransferase